MTEKIRRKFGDMPIPPIARLIGFNIVEVGVGQAVMELEAGTKHTNPMGTLHGGVICDVADAAMGAAYYSTLGEDESFTTLELKINFMKPVWEGLIRAEAKVIKMGKTIGLLQCEVTDSKKSLVAFVTSTCMTLRGESAEGR
ncbi:PaaI family thioesterase [Desulfosporosinus nitroreducens]|uniref:PaaI family thioesterase n=1 Tax=Desulfosporosinus nitroreducens TaxID=2018668 RepID=UPI00207D3295|nr:PaaI family thioesterase [Desulfosporosinus nitroreducens]MCO1602814.1 PaaI family thioesterase [Desulfosporosinus nitroreducens]